jgi:hypothetical protein
MEPRVRRPYDRTKPHFPGTKDAYNMLVRAADRGSLANFNDVIAEQLISSGLAVVEGSQLVPTETGRQMAETHRT